MKLSDESIKSLQALLKQQTGRDYSEVQAQEAGMAIMRFVVVKARRKPELIKDKRNEDEQAYETNEVTTY
jgi:hypothetical protein